jgi:apolipoprotein N-acyltransferase
MAFKIFLKYLLLTLISAILFSLSNGILKLGIVTLIAFVPFLYVLKNNNLNQTLFFSFLFFSFELIVRGILFEELIGNIYSFHLIELIIFCLPWVLYNFVSTRHNEKLGYLMLISSWLTVEWATEQYLGISSDFHLGDYLCFYPQVIGWYEITGSGGGTVIILLSNILITSFLWPSENTNRYGVSINYIIFIVSPIVVSMLSYPITLKYDEIAVSISSSKTQIIKSNPILYNYSEANTTIETLNSLLPEGSIIVKSSSDNPVFYNINNDNIEFAKKITNDSFLDIESIKISNQGIFGYKQHKIFITNISNQKIALLNSTSLTNNELIRMNASQNPNIIVGFEKKSEKKRIR